MLLSNDSFLPLQFVIFLFFNYDFNYKILEFFIIINGVFVVCMLCE